MAKKGPQYGMSCLWLSLKLLFWYGEERMRGPCSFIYSVIIKHQLCSEYRDCGLKTFKYLICRTLHSVGRKEKYQERECTISIQSKTL